ncbi:protein of unknown function [Micropruina glycogenica]|uniref:Uncharacterized protein n=1 Tax=Micropruina glycogenica TaxID=75385 RepID=A0A2N9JJB4_9ACTN|nr:protein of unknown function [Micropruina glycogenica]
MRHDRVNSPTPDVGAFRFRNDPATLWGWDCDPSGHLLAWTKLTIGRGCTEAPTRACSIADLDLEEHWAPRNGSLEPRACLPPAWRCPPAPRHRRLRSPA